LDCWKRGKKGIIITLGDEPLNPYLPGNMVAKVFGTNKQSEIDDIDTKELYKAASKKYHIYHIAVDDSETCYRSYKEQVDKTWKEMIGDNYKVANLNNLANTISNIIIETTNNEDGIENDSVVWSEEEISW
jgi:hypothetical protein